MHQKGGIVALPSWLKNAPVLKIIHKSLCLQQLVDTVDTLYVYVIRTLPYLNFWSW